MSSGYGPGPYLFGGPEGLEKAIDKALADNVTVRCPICTGNAPAMRDGDEYVIGEHEALVDGNHVDDCTGVGERVGENAVIKDQSDNAFQAA